MAAGADPARRAALAVDQARLWQRHVAMAEIGAIAGNGVNRQALSAEDIRARALLLEWAAARGYQPAVDDMANLFIRRPGRDPDAAPVVAGSHMDSQPAGGRFDGIFGVLAALEALEALDDAGIATRHPIDLVAWTNEEGGRYGPGCMGSAVFAGRMRLEDCLDLADSAGIRLGAALAETLAATPEVPRRSFGFRIAAYLEPHIEQGPQLEAGGLQVGVVTGIQGARWYVVEALGEPGHAGTAPLAGRKDALRAAVRMIVGLEELMHDPADRLRFTVGRLEVQPNSPNTVPARVTFSIDFRHPELGLLDDRSRRIGPLCQHLAGPCRVTGQRDFQPAALRVPEADRGRDRGRRAGPRHRSHAPALRRLPRCQLHRRAGAHGHDLRALRARHQPQPGRERQARGPGRRRPRPRRRPGRACRHRPGRSQGWGRALSRAALANGR